MIPPEMIYSIVTLWISVDYKISKSRVNRVGNIVWFCLDLDSDFACAEEKEIELLSRLLDECFEAFFHGERRASPTDVSGCVEEVFDMNHVDTFFACGFCGFLQIDFARYGENKHIELA